MLTVEELKETLRLACDEISILEVLSISVDDILTRFEDRIEERIEILSEEFENTAENRDEENNEILNSNREDLYLQRYFEDDSYQIIGPFDSEEGIDEY